MCLNNAPQEGKKDVPGLATRWGKRLKRENTMKKNNRKVRSDKGKKRGPNKRTNGLWIKVISGMESFLSAPFKQ